MSQSLLPVLQLCLRSLYRGSPLWELHGCRNSDRIYRTVFGLLPKICTGELGKTMNLLPLSLYEPELDIVGYDTEADRTLTVATMSDDLTEEDTLREREYYSQLIVKSVNSYDTMRLALLCAEADIEGIIGSGLVEGDHPVHQTLKDIQKALA